MRIPGAGAPAPELAVQPNAPALNASHASNRGQDALAPEDLATEGDPRSEGVPTSNWVTEPRGARTQGNSAFM